MSLCLSVENIKKMKKYLIYMFALLLGSTLFTACSESDDEVDEYPNWRATNEAYFNSLYATAKQRVAAGDAQWKVLKSWSLGEKTTDLAEDHIVARVISEGTGTERPLFTDSVRVHYRGRLLPSTSYADGYVFDQTYYGNFNPASAMPAKKAVAGVTAGFGTALQHMHIGDRCIECGECERVCPMDLPLMTMNRKVIRDMNELFGEFESGMAIGEPKEKLMTYELSDPEEFM